MWCWVLELSFFSASSFWLLIRFCFSVACLSGFHNQSLSKPTKKGKKEEEKTEGIGCFGDLGFSSLREKIMRFHHQSHCYQPLRREAIAGLFVLLFPVFLPCLFTPFSHASPSTFSVCSYIFLSFAEFSFFNWKWVLGSSFLCG